MINTALPFAIPVGRTLLASVFLLSGVSKIQHYAATQGFMESAGLPGALLPAVIAFEMIAPLAIIIGLQARIAAFLLAGFSVITAIAFHFDFSDQIQTIMFLKNISIAGGLLLVVGHGAGPVSLDRT